MALQRYAEALLHFAGRGLGGDQRHRGHKLGTVGRKHARHPVAEGVANHEGRAETEQGAPLPALLGLGLA